MRSAEVVESVLELGRTGLSAYEISRRTSIPRSTIDRWLRQGPPSRVLTAPPLPDALPGPAYAYLLGMYLGDGSVCVVRGIPRLEVVQDAAYPDSAREIAAAIRSVSGRSSAIRRREPQNMLVVSGYWRHWPAVLPQHGPGTKHRRRIALTDWQHRITERHVHWLVRGLIHSDGCRYVARQRSRGSTYEYARYAFSNRSEDIKDILCHHLDLLGVAWTRGDKQVGIDRRAAVAVLDTFVGAKR